VKYFVYCWTNELDGKHYIGKGCRSRHLAHLHPNSADSLLSRAMKKHGQSNFTWRFVAAGLDEDLAFALERAAIQAYSTLAPAGYNITVGGEGASGHKQSQETKDLRAAKLRGRTRDPAIGQKLSKIFKGRPNPKAAEAQRGTTRSPEHRASISATLTGHVQSEEQIAKRVLKLRGQKRTKEQCAMYSRVQLNRPPSVNEKILESRRKYFKLTPEKVRDIRERLARFESQQSIADRHNITQVAVSRIKLGRMYAGVGLLDA
jgi:group I intron endonuclease